MPKIVPTPPVPGSVERLNFDQAAAYLGVHPKTLQAWKVRGRPWVPHYKIGRKLMFDRAELDKFLAAHRVPDPLACDAK